MRLGLYRIMDTRKYRVGLVVIASQVEVGCAKNYNGKIKYHYVKVNGVELKGFTGASFICDIDETQAKQIQALIIKDVKDIESIR